MLLKHGKKIVFFNHHICIIRQQFDRSERYEAKTEVGSNQKEENPLFWGLFDTDTNIILKNHIGIVSVHPTRRLKAESPYFQWRNFRCRKNSSLRTLYPQKYVNFQLFNNFVAWCTSAQIFRILMVLGVSAVESMGFLSFSDPYRMSS